MSATTVAPTEAATEQSQQSQERSAQDRVIAGYLRALKDPTSTIDKELVEALENNLEASDDAVERIRIRAQLAKARQPRLDALRPAFIGFLAEWVKENEIPLEALREEEVPEKDLKDAGLIKTSRRGSPKGTSKDAEAWIKGQTDRFTVTQVADSTPVSRSTAAKTVTRLLEAGEIEEAGEVPSAQGRNAKAYKVKG